MKLPYYVADAFAEGPFTGNPAGVCPLETWPEDRLLQRIAAQNNLSETAFFAPEGDAFRLRWFAPGGEVDLCGHATLATAHVLAEALGRQDAAFRFLTKSGPIAVERRDGAYALDLPALPLAAAAAPEALALGLGLIPTETFRGMDWVAVLPDAAAVRRVAPDLAALKTLDGRGVIVTAPGGGAEADYVLRCFGPKIGIVEDPATGSAQSMLAPMWAARLGKGELRARQLSARGGAMTCIPGAGRVKVAGQARLYLSGTLSL